MIPSTVDDNTELNTWLINVANMLPKHISFCLIDYIGSEDFKRCVNKLDDKQTTLKCGRFDMQQMASDIISSQQNAEDPVSVFQLCVLEMGKATSSKNKISLNKWGSKALKAAQQSGSQSFLATAYLVYAGFAMQVKSKETLELLSKGEKLAQMACDNKEAEAPTVLMQIYGYYSAYYSIIGKRRLSCEWSLKQAAFAASNNLKEYSITIYRHTAQLSIKSYSEIYSEALASGYAVSLDIADEHIHSTEIKLLAHHYIKDLSDKEELLLAKDVEHRMSTIFGTSWKEGIPSLRDKHAQVNVNLTNIKEV